MMRKYYILHTLLAVIISNITAKSQDLQSGFDLLDSGQYIEAAVLFNSIVESQPENKTAHICLGRALGLGGQVQKAMNLFQDLDQRYPGDQEVILNMAEAYLWSKEPIKAEELYLGMLENAPEDVKCLIGLANAKASQKNYVEAMEYIQGALDLNQDKYVIDLFVEISLALAYDFKLNNAFNEGIRTLTNTLNKVSNDRIYFSLADLYVVKDKPKKALSYLNKIQHKEREHVTLMAYCYLLLQKPKKILSSLEVYQADCSELGKNGIKLKVEALLSLHRVEEAKRLLEHLILHCGSDEDVSLLRIRCQRQEYPGMKLRLDSTSQMNAIEATRLLVFDHKHHQALKTLEEGTEKETGRARGIYENVLRRTADRLQGGSRLITDIAGNTSTVQSAKFIKSWSDRHKTGIWTQFRFVSSQRSDRGQISSFGIQHSYRLDHRHEFLMDIGVQRTNFTQPANLLNFSIGHQFKVNDSHYLSLSLNHQTQAYTIEMAQAELTTTGVKLTHHFSRIHYPGVYFQAGFDRWSNDNAQWNTFISLYTFITRRPILKTGINVSAMGFSNNMDQLYFSPSIYTSGEAFLQLEKNDPRKKWLYFLEGAYGIQRIEDQTLQSTMRLKAQIGYRVTNSLSIRVEGFYNTSATTSIAGFTQQGGSINLSVLL